MLEKCESRSVMSDSVTPRILQARILEWVAFPFFRGSSRPRNHTGVSHIMGQILYQLSHQGKALGNVKLSHNAFIKCRTTRNQSFQSILSG